MIKYKGACFHVPDNKKIKIFVIGSLTQYDKIIDIAEKYNGTLITSKHVCPESNKPFDELVRQTYDNIEEADGIIVVKKEDGTIGQGTTYELEYAKRLNKIIKIIDADEFFG